MLTLIGHSVVQVCSTNNKPLHPAIVEPQQSASGPHRRTSRHRSVSNAQARVQPRRLDGTALATHTPRCWYLDRPRHIADIEDRLGITRKGVHSALSPLKYRAILSVSDPKSALRDDVSPLLAFARALAEHEYQARVRIPLPAPRLRGAIRSEYSLAHRPAEDTDAQQPVPNWEMAVLGRFAAYGVQFFPRRRASIPVCFGRGANDC